MSADAPIRVRIAPSPTGDPHVGTGYIGLFNYVYARKHGGSFVLRIEDTDRARSTPASETAIMEALRWLGLQWDEGPDVGGEYGPYRQSERLDLYRREVDALVAKGKAYPCFCTRERLDAVREKARVEKTRGGYDRHCRAVTATDAAARVAAGEAHVIRLAVPDGTTSFEDGLRGTIEIENLQIDDQVLMKSDGFPTYHLANVVDDHLMEITDVIRGEEWITSTPKHILLYRAFGWEPPRFVHLGLLRNADKSKLSKRKNPVSVFHYRDLGYLPSTFLNFLATLGFSFGDDRERFTVDEMVEAFEWSKVSAGGPVFDPVKLDAFSGDDLRALSDEVFTDLVMERVLNRSRIEALAEHVKPRINRLDDFLPYVSFFFGGAVDLKPVEGKLQIKKRTRKEVVDILRAYLGEIETDPQARAFTAEGLEAFSRDFCTRHAWKPREVFTLLRIASTGRTAAPSLFDTLSLCGKDRVRGRLRGAIDHIRQMPEW